MNYMPVVAKGVQLYSMHLLQVPRRPEVSVVIPSVIL